MAGGLSTVGPAERGKPDILLTNSGRFRRTQGFRRDPVNRYQIMGLVLAAFSVQQVLDGLGDVFGRAGH
jgi:hypothetical protein